MYGYINGYDFYNMKAEKYYAPTKNQNIQELVRNAAAITLVLAKQTGIGI